VELGSGAWQKYYGELADISFRYAPVVGDKPTIGLVDFVGNDGASFDPLDLDFDGDVALGDYHAFLTGYGMTLAGVSPAMRHNRGDLNGDGKHSVADFLKFKKDFETLRGPGSFEALVGAGVVVPEPLALVLTAQTIIGIGLGRGRGRHVPPGRSSRRSM
jgi:hypothetical protein